jgi:hypothetical protein
MLIGAAGLSLGGCAYDGVYGGGAALGYGYDAPFYDSAACWNSGWYGSYASPYCGWYDGFFYPGTGRFVYDRDRHRHAWTGTQQTYWTNQARRPGGGRTVGLGSSGGALPPGAGMPRSGNGGGVRSPMSPRQGGGVRSPMIPRQGGAR